MSGARLIAIKHRLNIADEPRMASLVDKHEALD